MRTSDLDYELPSQLIAHTRTPRRVAAARLRPCERGGRAPAIPRPRVAHRVPDACRRERHARPSCPPHARAAARRNPAPRTVEGDVGGAGPAEQAASRGQKLGPVELLEWLAKAVGVFASPVSPKAKRRYRPTSRSRSRMRTATRPSTPRGGSAAAPTAGLHFTPQLLASLDVERVTLHVGLDTFRPVTAEMLEEHDSRRALRGRAGGWARIRAAEHVLAVGTTTVRVLETLAPGRAARRPHRPFHHARLRVPAGGLAVDELPPAALDAARARDGVRGDRGDAPPLPARRRGAVRFYSFGDAMLIL